MNDAGYFLIDVTIILILFVGISQFRTPKGARAGNLAAAVALLCALGVILYRYAITDLPLVAGVVIAGGFAGWIVAMRVSMIQIPAMVAFQHGAGGVAVFLVSFVELCRDGGAALTATGEISGILGLNLGAATFSGSMVASGKLANLLRQMPTVLKGHNLILWGIMSVIVLIAVVAATATDAELLGYYLFVSIVVSALLGIVFSIRIGGADMPVLISFLNATSGLAAGFCGVVIGNRLLIACGATVAASGSILTYLMCHAMNRSLFRVLTGIHLATPDDVASMKQGPDGEQGLQAATATAISEESGTAQEPGSQNPLQQVIDAAKDAKSVVIVPGYGMALSEAEFAVVRLSEKLDEMGKQIRFAIHPVAGRMPGHMHVLLAEAEVDYDKLFEIDAVNSDFADTDLVLVVGACDVVNPAALDKTDTPIAGMPILLVHEARRIAVCNLDEKPGYSGVDNPLYENPKTILLLGEAKDTVGQILEGLSADQK